VSVLQFFHKTHKSLQNTRKTHRKILWKTHKKLTIRWCLADVFQEQKKSTVLHKTPSTKHLRNTAKHRNTLAKQSENAFCEITSKNKAKRTQNAQKRHKTLSQ